MGRRASSASAFQSWWRKEWRCSRRSPDIDCVTVNVTREETMALKTPASRPADEQEPSTTEPGAAVADRSEDGAAAAAAEATTAVATAAATSVAVNDALNKAREFKKEVEAMHNGADFSYGSHRVFKAKDGVIKEMSGEKLVLGKWVKA